jgi:hypothetical protein
MLYMASRIQVSNKKALGTTPGLRTVNQVTGLARDHQTRE